MNHYTLVFGVVMLLVGGVGFVLPAEAQLEPEEFIIEGVERQPGLSVFEEHPPEEAPSPVPTRDFPELDKLESPSEVQELVRDLRSPMDRAELEEHVQDEDGFPRWLLYLLGGAGLLILLL